MRHPIRKNRGLTVAELLVVIAIIGILIGMLLPAVQQIREAGRRSACQNKLRQVSLAAIHYESAHMHFPPGVIWESTEGYVYPPTNDGSRIATPYFLLAYLELDNLDATLVANRSLTQSGAPRWYLTSDFDGEGTKAAGVQTKIQQFLCPSANSETHPNVVWGMIKNAIGIDRTAPWTSLKSTNYISCGGFPRDIYGEWFLGIFGNRTKYGYGEIKDGASNTTFFGECAYLVDPWEAPTKARYCWNTGGKYTGFGSAGHKWSYNSVHAGDLTNISLADGSTHAFVNGMDFSTWIYMAGKHEGEIVNIGDYR